MSLSRITMALGCASLLGCSSQDFASETTGGAELALRNPALEACAGNTTFHVGAGIYDVTGPAAEIGMMGYAMPDQRTTGIHMRLRSRAFVVESPCNGKRAVYVSADLGMIFQAVQRAVVEKLHDRYGDLYRDENVLLTATHTHSGPGGFSHYALYNLTTFGFEPQTFEAVVDGIYESIVRAHDNVRPATLGVAEGDLTDASFNRSPVAYANNPAAERATYGQDTDKRMTVLRIDEADGTEAGMVSFFGVHPTNIGNKNRLISGDNKGLAAYAFEREKGTRYAAQKTFVAAFANTVEGDASPNLWGVPDTVHDYERNAVIAERQLDTARSLYARATTKLVGGVEFRHAWVRFADHPVDGAFTRGKGPQRTCHAAIGLSMIAGSTEDGPGIDFVPEGMTYDGVRWPKITLLPEDQKCHEEKVILLPTGRMLPVPWVPDVLPIQIVTLGDLALVAAPFEITTMAGRRLRERVAAELAQAGVRRVIVTGLANAYVGYMTTPEEYKVQHYEGASNQYGPHALELLEQEAHHLAVALREGEAVDPGPTPRDLRASQATLNPGVVLDDKPLGKSFGSVAEDAAPSYARGETARAVFWGGHPRNDPKTQDTFLRVQRKEGSAWVDVADDGAPETRFVWAREGISYSRVTIEWDIPADAPPGEYRLVHSGAWKSGWTGAIKPYSGTSRTFVVR